MVATSRARIAAPALVLALLVLGWDLAVRAFSVSASVLPSPGLVVRSTWDDRASLWPAVETTTKEAVLGILVAIVVAFVLAVPSTGRRSCAAPSTR